MNKDFRVATTFKTSRKRAKLMKRLGAEGVLALVDFWSSVAVEAPNGVLNGWDGEDIEIGAGWNGEDGLFVKTILEIGFLDREKNTYVVHDWKEWNGYACHAESRSARAKNAAAARWGQKNEENQKVNADSIADGMQGECSQHADSNAPTPTPTPTPDPDPPPPPEPEPADSILGGGQGGGSESCDQEVYEYIRLAVKFDTANVKDIGAWERALDRRLRDQGGLTGGDRRQMGQWAAKEKKEKEMKDWREEVQEEYNMLDEEMKKDVDMRIPAYLKGDERLKKKEEVISEIVSELSGSLEAFLNKKNEYAPGYH